MLKLISKAQANINTLKNKYLNAEDGATAIEYGLIAVLIALAIIGAVTAVGTGLSDAFTRVSTGLAG